MEASATTIFNNLALANVASILAALVPVQKGNVISWVLQDALALGVLAVNPAPKDITSVSQLEKLNLDLQNRWVFKNAYDLPNVGNRTDWYTDTVFAGQQFVGTNPTTIKAAPQELVAEFVGEAKKQNLQDVVDYLGSLTLDSLYVQDYRDFRDAVGVASDADLKDGDGDGARFQCAAVVLFNLSADGVLHPLAIVIDYKQSVANSVTIFNKRLRASDSAASEATDWPWRYAKLCAQTSDWARHEIEVHLTDTHLVEEVTIVAALRAFADTHPVYTLLSPHWLRTLSLNASARNTLVPQIIMRIVGFTEDQSYKFINYSFNNFDWEGSYPPNDLKRRGFPTDQAELDGPKYHNYAFARDILPMWNAIKSFVHEMLAISYTSDSDVASDADIQTWCDEIRGDDAGKLKSFPAKIETLAALEDAISFCIHIATNQHTAVNYLQQYYMTFVPNKPAALCVPLPKTLAELQQYKEINIVNSYPVNRPAEWLLSSHVPWLLSFRVEDKNSLSKYAQSLFQVNAGKKSPKPAEVATATAAKNFYDSLVAFTDKMLQVSKSLDDQTIPYTVLHPAANAVSILI
ncbi:Lipoxygenase [Pluteus cervinus]|uniref:Lipoxygenase n=1 Tax=Pluteus cervinus TaxID=181527 RepID=A0ACD3BEW0_9AGAR|nr:Lipoxygenase [Pluteus cervinus]